MMKIIIEPHYFPSIEYFSTILNHDHIIFEVCENYSKQTNRNRTYILTSQGIKKLIVPIKNEHRKIILKDVKIDNSTKWNIKHWRSIATAYGKAPYFIHYETKIKSILNKKHIFLLDLNMELLYLFLRIIRSPNIYTEYSSSYTKILPIISDFRSTIDKKKVPYNNTDLYKETKYTQLFGKEFYSNLSIIDLIMNKGPYSLDILNNINLAHLFGNSN